MSQSRGTSSILIVLVAIGAAILVALGVIALFAQGHRILRDLSPYHIFHFVRKLV